METFSAWPPLVLLAVFVFVVGKLPIFKHLDATPTEAAHRDAALDGLRAFLAFAVFFHHIALSRSIMEHGSAAHSATHYTLLGQAGVAVFFMITGFLFWGKLLDSDRIDWGKLYINRLFRIGPLYWAVVAVYFAVAFVRTKIGIGELRSEDLVHALRWIMPGTVKNPAPFLGDPVSTGVVGATWTLYYEWLYYASLPLLFVLARTAGHTACVVALAVAVYNLDPFFPEPYRSFVGLFLAGMFSASLMRRYPALRGDSAVRSAVAVALVSTVFLCFDSAYYWQVVLLLGAFFVLVASGTTIFGVLTLRGARRLGNASYSIYLTHGMVIMAVYSFNDAAELAVRSPGGFWLTACLAMAALVILSTATYVFVEKAGITAGRLLVERLRANRNGPRDASDSRPTPTSSPTAN